jgi:hypothetical protein
MNKRKDYNQTPCPSNCPVCKVGVFGTRIVRQLKSYKTMRTRWHCHYCNSFFSWEAEDRIIAEIETAFPTGLLGNVDVKAINAGYGVNWIEPKLPDEFDPPRYKHYRNFEE